MGLAVLTATAQQESDLKPETDGQVWLSAGTKFRPFARKSGKKRDGFRRNFKLGGELGWRLRDFGRETKQVNLTASPEYKVTDFLSFGLQYRWTIKDKYSANVQRLAGQLELEWEKDRLKLKSRTRFQHEFIPATDGLNTLRERVTVEYNIPDWKPDPHLSAETFTAMGYKGNRLQRMRYELGTDVELNKEKTRTLALAVRYQHDLGQAEPERAWILVLDFKPTFKKK